MMNNASWGNLLVRPLLVVAGVALAAGLVLGQCARLPDPPPLAAEKKTEWWEDKCDYEIPPIECNKTKPPIALPPLGPAIKYRRNQVWETRNGTLVQMNAPSHGELSGVTMPEPIEIEGYEGSTMFEFLWWRTDGVNTRGETDLDLVKRRPDIKPAFNFDEHGYAQ